VAKLGVPAVPVLTDHDAPVMARDGTRLRADVYRAVEGGPFPVLLIRNPYGEQLMRAAAPVIPAIDAGFAVVVQHCRGTGTSDGEFVTFENEAADGADAIEWCARQYTHDPHDPVPTVGGATLMTGGPGGVEWMPGPRDQREVESRPDVLSFTGDALTEDVEVTGPVRVTLHAATSAADTDFTAKLVDVWPDGRALGVTDGIVRARYRDGSGRAAHLRGKVAVVTDGASGIGMGIARQLIAEGMQVVIGDIEAGPLRKASVA
jgi:predicted acyl esterase